MFNEYSNLKFIILIIQAASMFFFPKDVVRYQKYLLNSGLWAALRAIFFSFVLVIEDSGVKLEQNE